MPAYRVTVRNARPLPPKTQLWIMFGSFLFVGGGFVLLLLASLVVLAAGG